MEQQVNLKCEHCNKLFTRNINDVCKRAKKTFCSKICKGASTRLKVDSICGNCGQNIQTYQRALDNSKSGYCFCSQSCAATYNNKLKKKSRRSKCEIQLYDSLVTYFPNLDIIANDKTMLNGLEVDIAIPSLKLAIEWNGVVHFKPIYGQETLQKIQTRDSYKLKLANELGINLIVIPDLVSKPSYVEQVFQSIINIIKDIRIVDELNVSRF